MSKLMHSKLIFIIFLILTILSCSNSKKPNYASDLENCLTENDIILINNAVSSFEKKILKKYKNQTIGNAYLSYLKDLNEQNIDSDFVLSIETKNILDDLKKEGTYAKIWSELEIILHERGRNLEGTKVIDIYTLNPNGIFLNCLIEKTKNELILEHLLEKKEIPETSYGFAVRDFSERLTENDFEENLNRMTIAIVYYYELYSLFEYLK